MDEQPAATDACVCTRAGTVIANCERCHVRAYHDSRVTTFYGTTIRTLALVCRICGHQTRALLHPRPDQQLRQQATEL